LLVGYVITQHNHTNARSGLFRYFYCTITRMRFEPHNIAHKTSKSFPVFRYQKILYALVPENQ